MHTHRNATRELHMPDGVRIPFDATTTNYLLSYSRLDADALAVRAYTNVGRNPTPLNSDLVHARLAHFSFKRIKASKNCTTGLSLSSITKNRCKSCELGGARQKAP